MAEVNAHIRAMAPNQAAYDRVVHLRERLAACPPDVKDVAASMLVEVDDLLPPDVICWVLDASAEVVATMAQHGMELVFANKMETIHEASEIVLEILA